MYDIEKVKRKMLVKYPFFGSVIANVRYIENDDVDTAETDGETIYYNSDFLKDLNMNQQVFVFAHEVCHIAFNHVLRSEGKDSKIWNIATDGVINQFLKRDRLEMVKCCIDIEEAINYDAEELYEKLLKEKEDNEDNNFNGNNNSEYNIDNMGHDSHSMWEDAVRKNKQNKDNTSNDGQSNKDNNQDGDGSSNNHDNKESEKSDDCKTDEVRKKQEELQEKGEKEGFRENREEKKKKLEEFKEEIIMNSLNAGNSTDSNILNISNIGRANPLIDWRYFLREAVKYDVDWSYINASIEDGVVCANLEDIPFPETEIVLDTSGSINESLLRNFLKECKNILEYSKVKVGCFDTKFYGFEEIKSEEDIDNMTFIGGGGTNFNTAVNAFSMRVENKIIFTDGEASMPNKELDAIWIVFGNEKINPKGGKVIYISNEDLKRLSLSTPNGLVREKGKVLERKRK